MMEKLKMHSLDNVARNIELIGQFFPNAITEVIRDGKVVKAIDFEVLKQELSDSIVKGREECYQFTWPDKKKSILLANTPISATLRPCREESIGKDGTSGGFDSENLYIEGDNLEVLKLLQETYLDKVKMIYIDPPYNTGKDFVYSDLFAEDAQSYAVRSGQYDDQGNQLISNTESNGRFHTNWLNMIYPRLKLAKDLLSDDGVIFISIDDNEVDNLRKICNEVFGEKNFIAQINWKGRGGRQDSKYYAVIHEYILCFARSINCFVAGEEIRSGDIYPKYDAESNRNYKTQLLRKWGSNSKKENRPNLFYPINAPDGSKVYPLLAPLTDIEKSSFPNSGKEGRWRWGIDTMNKAIREGRVEFVKQADGNWIPYEKLFAPSEGEEPTKKYATWIDDVGNGTDVLKSLFGEVPFNYSKSPELILKFLKMGNVEKNDIILDFFSGSATTAHAVMQLNAEDGGKRKFIMVQIPEKCAEDSEAYQAGYKNICEIGKERIRRAGRKIKEESPLTTADLDIGFRVLKLDSSNMEDVFYTPDDTPKDLLSLINNVKEDRTSEDLLFQVMLDLGILLSSKIELTEIAGKKVYNVEDNYLLACFDPDITEDVVTIIARKKPYYAVLKDSSMANDSVATNFEQIFVTYSPDTVCKKL